jgi:hypothetical protein
MTATKAHRSRLLVPVVVPLLTVRAVTAVWLLVQRADTSREAQLQIAAMKLSLADLQLAPFSADRSAGASETAVHATIEGEVQACDGHSGGPRRRLAPAPVRVHHLPGTLGA